MRALRLRPSSAMAIYAHPDDADVAAGGLLALWASEGCAVHLVVICDGAKGSHAVKANPAKLRSARREEMQLAADLLGASSVTCLERPDGGIENDEALRETLVGLVRRYRPQVVLGPDPTATFYGGVTERPVGRCLTPWPRPRRCPCTSRARASPTRSTSCCSAAPTSPTSSPT
jgi:LmbE family N-acetylglucosaminyl deacetylase